MLFIERSGTGRAMLNMAVREKLEKEIKKQKKNRRRTEKFAVCPLNLFDREQLFYTEK